MITASYFLKALTRLESVLAMAAYTAVAFLLIGDVIGREIFSTPIHGAQKMAVYAAIVAGFTGLSLATAENMHLRPSFLDGVIPKRYHNCINRLSDTFACLFFLSMAIFGALFVRESMNFGDKAAVLYWLLWPIQIIIPYAFFTSALRHGLFALYPQTKPTTTAQH
ncbi:hypothetical protein AB833_24700 [Chromatiales bacterium (ex Bugula neritina AB1)]|nr:hypothetical protein AB833_24700 [Chromatiales bacterium (ex Bugula neritina AB1)]